MDDFYISSDKTKFDLVFIHDYLSNHAYWSKGRSMEAVKKSVAHSLCFGLFTSKDKQIGFARIATDYIVFAWMMDAFIDEGYRGKGLGKYLINTIVSHPELQNVNGIGLRTNDAHELYRKFGFESITNPETWMYKKNK